MTLTSRRSHLSSQALQDASVTLGFQMAGMMIRTVRTKAREAAALYSPVSHTDLMGLVKLIN